MQISCLKSGLVLIQETQCIYDKLFQEFSAAVENIFWSILNQWVSQPLNDLRGKLMVIFQCEGGFKYV